MFVLRDKLTACSYFPLTRLIFHTTIPARRDAPLLCPPDGRENQAPSGGRWPVLIFSHGLGGSKNAYSHICGSLASYGMVVMAPEHRDGSVPASFIRKTKNTEAKTIPYRQIGSGGVEKIADGKRDPMLRIRCWELGLLYKCLLKMDKGEPFTNLAADKTASGPIFTSSMDIHTPGQVAWAGHSFGTATIIEFVKSVFYKSDVLLPAMATSPTLDAQITPASPLICLDLWALPLGSPETASLLSKPLPCYTLKREPTSITSPPLAILSQTFFDWPANRKSTISALSARSSPLSERFVPPSEPSPLMFYVPQSIHLSQSDFGPLFPWINRRALGAYDPERTIGLNIWAIVDYLRRSFDVGNSTAPEQQAGSGIDVSSWSLLAKFDPATLSGGDKDASSSARILDMSGRSGIDGWVPVIDKAPSTPMAETVSESDSGYVSSENKESTATATTIPTKTPMP